MSQDRAAGKRATNAYCDFKHWTQQGESARRPMLRHANQTWVAQQKATLCTLQLLRVRRAGKKEHTIVAKEAHTPDREIQASSQIINLIDVERIAYHVSDILTPWSALVSGEKSNFQFILRLLNTNVDGKQKIMYALTKIKGVGRRYSNLVCKKADVDLNKRAGEITSEELERIVTIIQNPTQYKIPTWFLNRQRDIVDGKDTQVLANGMDSKLREDLERLKKIRAHRGLRHYWGLRVRGQHSKTTGRRGRTVGVSKKKG
ncbi:MAG: hypothetical protein LQ339_005966 [Xanthoria mediterranea]|nr:MAG: hypothetical protein LQ339_005966 [Xanthoria mediterranea]